MKEKKIIKKCIWLIVRLCLLLAVLSALTVGLWMCLHDEYQLKLDLQGEKDITLEVGDTYTEPGAVAQLSGTRIQTQPVQVEITGEVTTTTLGDYIVRYAASSNGYEAIAFRTVHMVDTQIPVISLVSNPDTYTLPGHPYDEEGFTATDNYDGDITDLVKREEKDGVVTYTVTDSSGNTAMTTRTITYHDPEPPGLVLAGSSYYSMYAGGSFTDPGYSAVDNCDGDITDKVVVSGNLDTNKPGIYTVSYTVTDNFGNSAYAERPVYVLPAISSEAAPSNGKVIYLTFDDGPSAHTGRLLDILAKYNAKATFFVVNTGYISEITRAAQEGHTVAIHTAAHRFESFYASDDAYFADLYQMQSIITNLTGQTPMLLRFPGGSSNTISKNYNAGIMSRLTNAVRALGFQYFDWNVDSRDAGGASSSDQVYYNVVTGIGSKQASVVLQHDIKGFSVDAVERILVWGISNGYSFQALTLDSPGCHHGVNN